MSLDHHFLILPTLESQACFEFREQYIVDGQISWYNSFDDVPKPIDGRADTIAGDMLMQYFLKNKVSAVGIHDDIIYPLLQEFKKVKSYYIGFVPCVGLNYYGITLIPKESIGNLIYILENAQYKTYLDPLITLCNTAKVLQQDILHLGI